MVGIFALNLTNLIMYYIEESSGPDIGTDYPQAVVKPLIYPLAIDHGVYELMRYFNELPDFEPKIGDIIVSDTAILTDIISSSFFGMYNGKLLSEKALKVLLTHRLPNHKAYKVNIIHHDKRYTYYWLHIVACDISNKINYEKSSFYIANTIGKKISDVNVQSYNEYIEVKKKIGVTKSIKPHKLYVIIEPELDLFHFNTSWYPFIISEELKTEFQNQKITGLYILQLPAWITISET